MSEIKFNIGQDVVYPSQGVGRITEIFEKEFRGVSQLYYKMYIEASDMIVLVPVEKACELGIRSIVNAEEAQSAINILSEEVGSITSDWKLRYQSNLDLLKKAQSQISHRLSAVFITEAKLRNFLFLSVNSMIRQKNFFKMKFQLP